MSEAQTITVSGADISGVNFTAERIGTLKWKYQSDCPAYSAPVYPEIGSDGTVYIGSRNCSEYIPSYLDELLYAINLDGTLKWKYPSKIETKTDIPPYALKYIPGSSVGNDGTIYVGSDKDKAMYAFNPDGAQMEIYRRVCRWGFFLLQWSIYRAR